MRCGLYGKLPAKRDFVAVRAPRAFLRVFEPWLEKGLAAARAGGQDDHDFAAAFNTAPIWRFWLGPALCGEAVAGALMPSVDALGRMYPLTLIGAPAGAPPDIDARDAWFAAVEDFLLAALDLRTPYEATIARLDALDAGPSGAAPSQPDAPAPERGPIARTFAAMRALQPDCPADSATFWWTIGGAGWPPLAMTRCTMPAPTTFADMLAWREDSPPPPECDPLAAAQTG